jgi:hypothetical protein
MIGLIGGGDVLFGGIGDDHLREWGRRRIWTAPPLKQRGFSWSS